MSNNNTDTKHEETNLVVYFNTLLSTTDSSKKTSEVNIANQNEVISHARSGVNTLALLESNIKAFQKFNLKLTGFIKSHLNHLDDNYISSKGYYSLTETLQKCSGLATKCSGDLTFIKPSVFLKAVSSSDAMAVTTGNKDLSYAFLMYRKIMGEDAESLLPDYVVSFDKNAKSEYSTNDLLRSFDYKVLGSSVDSHYTDQGKKKMDPHAKILFQNNVKEVEGIIKNVMYDLNAECNILKETDLNNKKIICNSISDTSNPDHFVEYMTCMEIFNLANKDSFCTRIEYENEDL